MTQSGPIRQMLERYVREDALRFHMPGHKGMLNLPGGAYDLTEVPGTDELFDPKEGILEAARAAAKSYRADTSFLLVNGSTAGLHAMALWARTQGRRIVLPRDCHLSAVYAAAIAGEQPVWIQPEWDSGEQLFRFDTDRVTAALPAEQSAVLITYPDYYGRCADLNELKARLDAHGAVLLADAAHGSHFAFSDTLPQEAGTAARLWVTGAHKTLPAPTQTAFLHAKHSCDARTVARLLRSVTTASPSYLLMTGLDDARAYMDAHQDRLARLIDACRSLEARLNRVDGLRCLGEEAAAGLGYSRHDPTRLVVDVRGLGMSGWEAGARLRALGLQAEMCDIYRVVLITSVMDERLDDVYETFLRLAREKNGSRFERRLDTVPAARQAAMTVRDAWLSPTEETDIHSAAGRIAAEPFGAYPPGIPLCMPGEMIECDMIELLDEASALGGGFFGIAGGRVSVVCE